MPEEGKQGEKPSFDGIERPKRDHEQEKIERLRRAMYSRSIAPNIKDKPRRILEPTRPPVGEEWIHHEPHIPGAMTAPRTMGLARNAMRWILVAAVAFFVGAAGFFGYYFFFGGGSTPASPGNIDISVSGPLLVASGEPTELQIAVVNRNRVALELADLVIEYPDGTRSPTDLSTSLPSQRISLGTIEPGGRRQGTVSAIFAGVEGNRATIKVELEYRLTNSSAIFAAASDYQITFASSPLTLAIEGNSETVSGQPIEFNVTISSNADAPVKDVLMNASFPFGFSLTQADPKPSKSGTNLWVLGDIPPGGTKSILVRGVVSGESGDERVFRFTVGTRKDMKEQSIGTVLADYAHHLTVSRPFLGLVVSVNKEEQSAGAVISPGETVNVAVQYQNNLTTAITDAVVVARLSGIDIDGATMRSTDGFYRSSDNVVLWDKSTTNGALANVTPGARGTLHFSFQMPGSNALVDARDPKFNISINAAGRRVSESGVPETLQASTVSIVRLASDLQLIAQGLYYANPFGSTGPMPPKAGSETTYAIVFSITNTTNKIEKGKVRAVLPAYVRWVGIYSPSSEKIAFNQNDGTLTWDVGDVDPGVGVNGALPRQMAIAVGFTPSTSQIGQQPQMVRQIVLTGTDAATKETVTRTAPDITTNINGDPGFGSSNATVVK